MNIRKFDLFGLYPRPVAEMSSVERLFSAFITVFFILGIVTIIQTALVNFRSLAIGIAVITPLVAAVYYWLYWLKLKCKEDKGVSNAYLPNTEDE